MNLLKGFFGKLSPSNPLPGNSEEPTGEYRVPQPDNWEKDKAYWLDGIRLERQKERLERLEESTP